MKKTVLLFVTMLCLMAGLCACKKEEPAAEFELEDSMYSFSADASGDLQELRDEMDALAEESTAAYRYAIAYLGYADVSECAVSVNQLAYNQRIADGGYEEDYLFLAEIPSDKIVETESGNQIFCVVPRGNVKNVRVSLLKEEEGAAPLYSRNNADPVVLSINPEGRDEVCVQITDDQDNIFSFVPRLRETDGHPDCGEDGFDFTVYPEAADAAYIEGTWRCAPVADDGGSIRYAEISFDADEKTASYALFSEDGTELLHYTGTWSFAPDGMEIYEEGALVLDLMSDGGVYMSAGAVSTPFEGAFNAQKAGDGSLIVRNVYGDPLIFGSEYCDLIFTR